MLDTISHRIKDALSLRIVISLTVIVGVALSSVLVYLEQTQRFRETYMTEKQTELERLTVLTALSLREPLWQLVPEQADSMIEAVFINPEVLEVTVRDPKGVQFAGRVRSHTTENASLSHHQEVVRDGEVLGVLIIRMSTAGYVAKRDAVIWQYGRTALLTLTGALLFILAVMHLRFVGPVKQLVQASERLARGDLYVPISIGPRDELGALAQSLEATRISLLDLFGKLEARNADLKDANENLERRVAERTRSLEEALSTLNRAQQEIIQSEKLASLGRVVAGVAHELNTPIGNAVVVASSLAADLKALATEFASGTLRRSSMTRLLGQSQTGIDIFMRNLERAARIVGDFKQVAVDQTSNQRRSFDVADVTREWLTTLHPFLRKSGCTVNLSAQADLLCDSFPGAYGQILNNLIMNAVLHGYDGKPSGVVAVTVESKPGAQVQLSVTDQGNGMTPEVLKRIYDPFFTTKLGAGGSGLGLNIVHGIVIRILGGNISVTSEVGKGTQVMVVFPCVAPILNEHEIATAATSAPSNPVSASSV
jgi:signal transduction histidine kinase